MTAKELFEEIIKRSEHYKTGNRAIVHIESDINEEETQSIIAGNKELLMFWTFKIFTEVSKSAGLDPEYSFMELLRISEKEKSKENEKIYS